MQVIKSEMAPTGSVAFKVQLKGCAPFTGNAETVAGLASEVRTMVQRWHWTGMRLCTDTETRTLVPVVTAPISGPNSHGHHFY